MDEIGYTESEAIPALMAAVVMLALATEAPEQALDEAAALLDREEEE